MSNSNIDPFDEFEFKPLTDGLGFHKKSVKLKETLKTSGVLDDALQPIPTSAPTALTDEVPKAAVKKHTFEDVLSALEKPKKGDLQFTEPLPRDGGTMKKSAMDVEIPRPVQSPFPQPTAYKSPGIKKVPTVPQMASVGTRRGAADSPQRKLQAATMSLESALLDFIIVLGLSLVFMMALLMVTKVDLNIVMKNLNTDPMTQLSMGVMFLAVMQMYVIIARTFFGCTLGEWTFDLQIGEDAEQKTETYPLKVALRSLLVTITGLIPLPLISSIIGRDIAGEITGAKLYRQRV